MIRYLALRVTTATLALWCVGSAWATTYVLDPDGTGDFSTIQEAIAGASGGDVIELVDGVFRGEGNRDIDFLGKPIVLRSRNGNPEACTIDCEGSPGYEHRGFIFQSAEGPETRIEGVTLTGAHRSETAGAVLCRDASPTFIRCVFSDNTSWYSGGAAYCVGCSSSYTDCVFSGNTAYESGGGMSLFHASPTFLRCRFSDNESVMYHGGAMRCNASSPTLTDCVFEFNTAYGGGGAIRCYPSSHPVLTGCVFVQNGASLGGAVDCFSSSPALIGCVFEENAASYGGGVRCDEASPYLSRCTFVGNRASYGGGIWCEGGSSPVLDHTLIAFNDDGAALGCDETVADLALTCCNIYGNPIGDWVGCIDNLLGRDGNLSEDPLFCEGCLYLRDCSPCVDADGCGQIGARGIACPCDGGPSAVDRTTWGRVKTRFRE